jgi:hypothetical protein
MDTRERKNRTSRNTQLIGAASAALVTVSCHWFQRYGECHEIRARALEAAKYGDGATAQLHRAEAAQRCDPADLARLDKALRESSIK